MKRKILITAISISLALIIVFSVFALPSTLWQNRIDKLRNISVHEAYAIITYKLNQTYMVILDVRNKTEFDAGHLANAINIPHWALQANLSDPAHCPLNGHKNDLILVYCLYGGRGAIACEILATDLNIGPFTNIYNMIGGITEWTNPAWNYPLAPPYTIITATEAYNMIISGSCRTIVDVLTSDTFNTEHIVNSTNPPYLHAINIPYYDNADFGNRVGNSSLPGKENENIIVYCASSDCSKGAAACDYLVTHGYTKIFSIDGGIAAWKAANKPIYPPTTWILVGSYSESNLGGASYSLKERHPSTIVAHSGVAQSFTSGSSQHLLMACKVYLRKAGSPAGTLTARLYAHSGTYGTSSLPVEASMIEESATSLDLATGLTTSYALFSFDFAGITQLTANTHYCVAIMVKSETLLNDSNYVLVGVDTSTPTHSGNCALYENNKWIVSHLQSDMIFYVYGT